MSKENKYAIAIEGLVIFIVFSILKIMLLKNDVNKLIDENTKLHNSINECVFGKED